MLAHTLHAKIIKPACSRTHISSNIADIKIRELMSKQKQLQRENESFKLRIAEQNEVIAQQNELIDELNDEVDYLNDFLTHPLKIE